MTSESQKPSGTRPADRPQEHHFQHDPDKTELERMLNRGLEKIEPYSNQILLGSLLVTVVAVAAIFVIRNTHATQSEGWKRFIACRVPDDFAELADAYPDTELGAWARLQQARGQMREGLQQALTNRSASDDNLNHAKEAFETLLNKGKSVPTEVREEALYGLATCLEALSDGNNEPAIQAYEELIKAYPETQHRLWAERRIEELKKGASQEFYAWFRQQDPSPADRPLPNDFSSSLDSSPDMSLPNFDLTLPPGAGSPPASKGTGEKGLDESTTPPAPASPEPLSTNKPAGETAGPKAEQPAPNGEQPPAPASSPDSTKSKPETGSNANGGQSENKAEKSPGDEAEKTESGTANP